MKQNNGSPYNQYPRRRLLLSSGDIMLPKGNKTNAIQHQKNNSKSIPKSNYSRNSQHHQSKPDNIKDRYNEKISDNLTAYKQQYDVPVLFSHSIDPNNINKSIDISSKFHTINHSGKRKMRLKSLQLESRSKNHRYHTISHEEAIIGELKDRYRIKSNIKTRTNVKSRIGMPNDNNFDQYIRKQLLSIDLGDIKQPKVLDHLDHKYLADYQKEQIISFKHVYYLGHKAYQRKHLNHKFNDQKGNYKPIIGDHIGYRFEIIKILGSGAFGKVLQVFDHKTKKLFALKILKESEDLYQQFQLEVKILKIARDHASVNKNIIQIKGNFQFRGHICIVMEMLSLNLYSFLKAQNYEGMQIDVIRKILIQLLQALAFMHNKNIIHCDIKLQNIVFREMGKSGVKIIDFGSACFSNKKQFTYIQSRYYRAPEIVLIKPYDRKIDIWSLGCVLFELSTGTPLFPSRNQTQQMAMVNTTLGTPPSYFLKECQRGEEFNFQKKVNPQLNLKSRLKSDNEDFIDLVESMIKWSPEERIEAIDALKHPFIVNGLPKQVREEHMKQMNGNNPYTLFS